MNLVQRAPQYRHRPQQLTLVAHHGDVIYALAASGHERASSRAGPGLNAQLNRAPDGRCRRFTQGVGHGCSSRSRRGGSGRRALAAVTCSNDPRGHHRQTASNLGSACVDTAVRGSLREFASRGLGVRVPLAPPQVSNTAPSFEAHHGARRFGAGCGLLMRRAGRILKGFVVVDLDASVVPVSP